MIIIPSDTERRKTAIAYVRVSSDKQKDNESPATQRKKVAEYAEANNIEIIRWFEDIAQSAKTANRKELKNLLHFTLTHRGKIDHLIVYKMSRASRDAPTFYADIMSILRPKGITIRSATESFDDSPGGKFMQLLHLGMAEFDNGIKSEYTKDVMQQLALQGYYQHPPVVGYEVCKIKNSEGKYRPSLKHSSMAPKVKAVLERFSVGDISKAELTRYAEEVGLRSRNDKVLGKDSINRLLINMTYAGYIKDCHTNFEEKPGKHPQIISKATYDKNQTLLHGKHNRIDEIHLKKNEGYVLKGTLLCAGCNRYQYASAPRTGNGGHSPRYHCGKGCQIPSFPAKVVHAGFKELLKQIKPTPGAIKLYKEILIREMNSQLGRINKEVEGYRDTLNAISTSRVNGIQQFTAGELTKDEKDDLMKALEAQKQETSLLLEEAEQKQSFREADINAAMDFMEHVDKQWETVSFDMQQRFQKMIFPQGVTYDLEKGTFGTSEISILYRLTDIKKSPQGTQKFNLVAGAGLEPATSWL
jgi:site-specific DNA recombinase